MSWLMQSPSNTILEPSPANQPDFIAVLGFEVGFRYCTIGTKHGG
jgi:hypothetical protein